MKAKKLDQRQLSANLGSTILGRVTAKAGYFGALELVGSVAQYAALGARRRLRSKKAKARTSS